MNPAKCAKDTKNRALVQAVRLAHRVNPMIIRASPRVTGGPTNVLCVWKITVRTQLLLQVGKNYTFGISCRRYSPMSSAAPPPPPPSLYTVSIASPAASSSVAAAELG